MNTEMQRLQALNVEQSFLAKNKGLWIGLFFLATLAFRFGDFYLFREFNADKAHQLQAAYELLHGKGVSLESYDLTTFQSHSRPLIAWPPGYSYLVAGISKVSGLSVYHSSWCLDVLTLAALWCALLWFTFLLRFSVVQTAALFLLLGFSRTPWIYLWSADTLGTVLFLFAAALNVWFVQAKKKKSTIVFCSVQAVLILTMCFLKYSLMPVYVPLGLSVLSYSLSSKEKHYRTGILLFVLVAASLGLLMLYNKVISGETSEMGNLSLQHTGFFLSNLGMFSPFFVKSFFYIDDFLQKASKHWLETSILFLNFLLLAIVLFHAGRRIMKRSADYFTHLFFWATIGICGFLTLLSIRYGEETFIGTYHWTYVKEMRYFSPVILLLALYLVKNFRIVRPQMRFSFFAFAFVTLAIVYSFALSSYYTLTKNRAGSFENMMGRVVRADEFVREKQDSNTYFVSLTGNSATDAQITSLVAMNGSKVVISYDGIFPDQFLSPLFTKGATIDPHKKVIVFLSQNLRPVDSLNTALPHKLVQDKDGENFLLVNP